MFKRLLWLTIGASLGLGTSFWVARAVRHTVERCRPRRVTSAAAGTLRSIGRNVAAAAADGREAMHEREAVLRAQLESRHAPRSS